MSIEVARDGRFPKEGRSGVPHEPGSAGVLQDSAGGLQDSESAGELPGGEAAVVLRDSGSGGGLQDVAGVLRGGGKAGVHSGGGGSRGLLVDFKERICDCIGLVCKMENQERIAVCILIKDCDM